MLKPSWNFILLMSSEAIAVAIVPVEKNLKEEAGIRTHDRCHGLFCRCEILSRRQNFTENCVARPGDFVALDLAS